MLIRAEGEEVLRTKDEVERIAPRGQKTRSKPLIARRRYALLTAYRGV
jgi:hypothetical protein